MKGTTLFELVERNRLPITYICQLAGVSPSTWKKSRRRGYLTPRTAKKIAAALRRLADLINEKTKHYANEKEGHSPG